MPRLPSAENIGRDIPQPQRGIVSYRGDQTAIAMQQAGDQLERTGYRLDAAAQERQNAQNRIEAAYAQSHYLRGSVANQQKYAEDQDYATIPKRFAEDDAKLKSEALNLIKDPDARSLFEAQLEVDSARNAADIQTLARGKERDYAIASMEQSVFDNEQAIASAPDETTRARLMRANQDMILGLRDRGFIDATKAGDYQRGSAERMAEAYATSLPPAEIIRLLGTAGTPQASATDSATLDRIAQIESNGNPNAVNPKSGAAGLFQFMPETARQYGLSDPKDPAASREAAGKLLADNRASLTKSLGREPTPGELYLAHQQGAAGAAALLKNPDRPAVAALTDVYGSAYKARAAIVQNGGTDVMTAGEFAQKWTDKFGDTTLTGSAGSDQLTATKEKTGTLLDFLPYDRKAALLKSAMAAQVSATADQEKELKAKQAAIASDLELNVKRGNASYSDIEQAYRNGDITPAKRTELSLWADDNIAKKQADAAAVLKVASGIPLDPKNKGDRKALNTFYDSMTQQWQAENADPAVILEKSTDFAIERGMVPDALQATIRGGLRSGNAEQAVGVSNVLRRIQNGNPRALSDFSAEDIRFGTLIGSLADAGYPAKEAFSRAIEAEQRTPEQQKALEATFKTYDKDHDPESYIKEGLATWGDDPNEIPAGMLADFNAVARSEYGRTGNMDAARKLALQKIGSQWGVTEIGGAPGYMRQAPEKVYGIAGKSASDNASWISEQLMTDLGNDELMKALRIEPDNSNVFLTYAPASGDKPEYIVTVKNGNDFIPLARTWKPDYATSAQATKDAQERTDSIESARKKRTGMNTEPSHNMILAP